MKHKLPSAAAMILLTLLATPLFAGEMVDRIVAVVDKQVILESDWNIEVRYQCFLNGTSPAAVTTSQRDAALDRLIDRALIQQQIEKTNFVRAAEPEITSRVEQVRKQKMNGSDPAAWAAALASYGLDDAAVHDEVAAELDVVRFVELRFRPSVHVDPVMVANYYRDSLVPELEKQGAKAPPLAEVSARIEEILVQQELDKLVSNWLRALHSQAEVRRITPQAELAEDAGRLP